MNDRKKQKEIKNAMPRKGKARKHSDKLQVEAMHRSGVLALVRKRPYQKMRQVGVDALSRAWIDKDNLEVEPFLQESMWVEYRYMSPWERNERFYQAYLTHRRKYYGAKHRESPVAGKLAWSPIGDINAVTRARIEADRAGVPYDIYCKTVIDGHMRDDKWDQPPQPNQMYGKLNLPRLRRKLTREEISKRLFRKDWDPRFAAANYRGDPIQEAALKLLREDVHASPNKAQRLRTYLRDKHAITVDRAKEMFGADMVQEALGKYLKALPGEEGGSNYRPGCYGLASGRADAPCVTCPLLATCKEYRIAVTEECSKLTGSDDPRRDHVREMNAKRSQRRYEKAALAAGKQVTQRERPRTDGRKVGAHTARLANYTPTKVPDVPTVYTGPQDKWLDDFLGSLSSPQEDHVDGFLRDL